MGPEQARAFMANPGRPGFYRFFTERRNSYIRCFDGSNWRRSINLLDDVQYFDFETAKRRPVLTSAMVRNAYHDLENSYIKVEFFRNLDGSEDSPSHPQLQLL